MSPSSPPPVPVIDPPPVLADTPAPTPDHSSAAAAGGPLVAVCGLQGGAGTSTIANLLAVTTAAADRAAIVLCEAPGASGDQAGLLDTTSRLSLAELARTVADGRPPRRFWGRADDLRVLATPPQPAPLDARPAELGAVLGLVQAEHALTVVDTGTVRDPYARAVLTTATHVLWVLRLEPGAIERARAQLASPLVPPLAARQALLVRGATRPRFAGEGPPLRALAADHLAELVLVPDLPREGRRPDPRSARARRLTTALARLLAEPWHA
jgi:hypothetical protein